MEQSEKIKELKEISVAYKCALEYDYCPEGSEADDIVENLFDYDKEELIGILNKYCGWSPGDLEGLTFTKINEL